MWLSALAGHDLLGLAALSVGFVFFLARHLDALDESRRLFAGEATGAGPANTRCRFLRGVS